MKTIYLIGWSVFIIIAFTSSGTIAQSDYISDQTELTNIITLGDSLDHKWQLEEALSYYHTALDMAKANHLTKQEADLNSKIAQIYFKWSQFRKALNCWENALTVYKAIGDKKGEAECLYKIGSTNKYWSKILKAIVFCEKSIEICKAIGDDQCEAYNLCTMGATYTQLARYHEALNCLEQSVKIFKDFGDKQGEAEALLQLGNVYYQINDYTIAREYYQKSMAIFKESGDLLNEKRAQMGLAKYYNTEHEFERAMEIYNQTYQISRIIKNRYLEAMSLNGKGTIHYNLAGKKGWSWENRDLNKLRESIEYYNLSMEIFRELGCKINVAVNLEAIGFAYFQLREWDKSLENYEKSLLIFEELNSKNNIQTLLWRIGWCYERQKQHDKADDYYAESIRLVDDIRKTFNSEALKINYIQRVFSRYQFIIRTLLEEGKFEKAFEFSERCRARSFLDILASSEVKLGKNRHADFFRKEEEFREFKEEIEKQIAFADDDTAQVANLRGKLEQEWESINDMIEEKRQFEPELVSMVFVDPITLPEIQSNLDDETTLLEYYIGKYNCIWLITKNNFCGFKFEVSADSIDAMIKAFRNAVISGSPLYRRSRDLYDFLFAPVENQINTTKLIIVPYRSLHYVPFQALQDKEGKYLVEKYQISYLPSASVLKYFEPKKRPKGETLLALGNPKSDNESYKPVPFTEQEVLNIAELHPQNLVLTEADATESNFRKYAPQYDILHFACHSELNSSAPLLSNLLLAPGGEHDGVLNVYELFTMDLNAYLVTLSACQTGLGNLMEGEELMGLSRAFIYAGTPSVICSLWAINDNATAYLMTQFYKNLKIYDKAESLQRAQLATKEKYVETYYWAPFILIGDSE